MMSEKTTNARKYLLALFVYGEGRVLPVRSLRQILPKFKFEIFRGRF